MVRGVVSTMAMVSSILHPRKYFVRTASGCACVSHTYHLPTKKISQTCTQAHMTLTAEGSPARDHKTIVFVGTRGNITINLQVSGTALPLVLHWIVFDHHLKLLA